MHYSKEAKQKFFDMFLEYLAAGCTFAEAYRRVCSDLTGEHKLAPNMWTFRRWYHDRMTGKDRAETADQAPETEAETVAEQIAEETAAEESVPDEETVPAADDYTHRLELVCRMYRTHSEASRDDICDYLLPELCNSEPTEE